MAGVMQSDVRFFLAFGPLLLVSWGLQCRGQGTGAPVITAQPQNQTVTAGSTAFFSIKASGTPTLTYQWRLNGLALQDGTNSSYTVADALPGIGAGQGIPDFYDVVVSNAFGSTTSKAASLTVYPLLSIPVQPQSQTVSPGQNAAFSVGAVGSPPLGFQWRFNGQPLKDNYSSLTNYPVANAQWSNAGPYDVIVTDASGSITSQVAVLTVRDTNQPVILAPSNLVAKCDGSFGANVDYSVSVSDPYDKAPVLICTPPSGSQFPMGLTLVTCFAKDSLGNTNVATFPVQVVGACDIGCIALSVPADIQAIAGAFPTAKVIFTALATNVCTGQPYPVYCSPPSGSEFPLGTNLVTCIASAGGDSKTATFNVIVSGAAPPVVRVPPLVVVPTRGANASGQLGAYVFYHVNVTDGANLKTTVQYFPASGSFFNVGTNLVTTVVHDPLGNTIKQSFPIVVTAPPVAGFSQDNWGFENPIAMVGWNASGSAFYNQPVVGDLLTVKRITALRTQLQTFIGGDYWQNVYYSVGHKGQRWVCTANVDDWGPAGNPLDDLFDDALTGTLVSKSFVIEHNFVTFLIGGMNDTVNLRVELLVEASKGVPGVVIDGTNYSVFDYRTGNDQELMRREWWDASTQVGKAAHIRIIDNSTTGHLNVDDFRFQDVSPSIETVMVGDTPHPAVVSLGGFYYDWDSPIWGFADMHTHPMSNLGFGQKLIHGQADGGTADPSNPAAALGDCNCDHGGWGLDNTCGDYFRQLIMGATDDGGPDPHREGWDTNPFRQFRKWPVFSSLSHQQMWYEWIKRTYDGGERVLVALAVNNRLLATASKGVPGAPHDDQTVADLQIAAVTNFVARHSDFMEIAYDPFQLRDIVRRDKLAIILGTEIDDLGDFVRDPLILPNNINGQLDPYSRTAVRAEIQRLYNEGVRYVFTVHLADNKFGGTPAVDDLLNIGSKFLNGHALYVTNATANDDIQFWLSGMDYTRYISSDEQAALTALLVFGGPLLPVVEPAVEAIVPGLAIVPPGAGSAMLAPLLPIATLLVLGAEADPDGMVRLLLGLAGVPSADANDIVNAHLLPLPGNYPAYPDRSAAPNGVINASGLTDLGAFAVREMMKRGMILDVDHMSQLTLDAVLNIATNVPVGYPLNSGHNSFRETSLSPAENHRSPAQLEMIRQLGGLMGVGWENAKGGSFTRSFADLVPSPQFSASQIANDCAGTSKTWAQLYLYALERLRGQNVAFGTDADGMIQFPGPRFGGQSAYGLRDADASQRPGQIEAQGRAAPDGVAYSPAYGNPLTTAAFFGRAVDSGGDTDPPHPSAGYEYNKGQSMFWAAIPIFYWEMAQMTPGETQDQVNHDLEAIENGLSDDNPNKRHTKEYAFGLIDGLMGWNTGWDWFDGDVGTCQQLGKSIYLSQVAHASPLSDVLNDSGKLQRYNDLLTVWNHYHRVFGANTPLLRCQTGFKQWDINFEGVAHYGLIPDFLQDLSNVGMQAQDLSVLFRSAEGFAQMWTKCLTSSAWFTPRFYGPILPDGAGGLLFSFSHGNQDAAVEETGDVTNPNAWVPANVLQYVTNGLTVTIRVPITNSARFYRLRTQ